MTKTKTTPKAKATKKAVVKKEVKTSKTQTSSTEDTAKVVPIENGQASKGQSNV